MKTKREVYSGEQKETVAVSWRSCPSRLSNFPKPRVERHTDSLSWRFRLLSVDHLEMHFCVAVALWRVTQLVECAMMCGGWLSGHAEITFNEYADVVTNLETDMTPVSLSFALDIVSRMT